MGAQIPPIWVGAAMQPVATVAVATWLLVSIVVVKWSFTHFSTVIFWFMEQIGQETWMKCSASFWSVLSIRVTHYQKLWLLHAIRMLSWGLLVVSCRHLVCQLFFAHVQKEKCNAVIVNFFIQCFSFMQYFLSSMLCNSAFFVYWPEIFVHL